MARLFFVVVLHTLLLTIVQASSNSTKSPQEEYDDMVDSMITMGWACAGFFAFTATINGVGVLYDYKMGRNKVWP